ncbi:insulinase family protein, partial [Candidatus Saccharibacteria bacterium]|nr:insulinase family protein [Candidatus Saccharibacteria bacterium]
DADSVTVQFFIGAGGRYEDMTREYGVSHFLEHLLFKGSQKYPTPKLISEMLDGVGGYSNAYTTPELTSFFAKVPKQHFELAVDILSDIVTAPLFQEAEIDRERGVILEEMNLYRDDPAQHVFDYVNELMWPHDPLRGNILGTPELIRSLPREIIKNYHSSLYTMDNMVIAVAGNILPDQIQKVLQERLGGMKNTHQREIIKSAGPIEQNISRIVHQPTNQAHLVLAGRALPRLHPDEAALRVLTALLGGGLSSRLYVKVRENKGLAYSIFMSTSSFSDTGSWEIYAGATNERLEEAISAILQELEVVRSKPILEEELSRVQQQITGRIIMGLETNGAVADRIGSELLLSGQVRSLDAILEEINAVTIDDVMRVAQRYLDPSGIRLALIAPQTTAKVADIERLFTNNE